MRRKRTRADLVASGICVDCRRNRAETEILRCSSCRTVHRERLRTDQLLRSLLREAGWIQPPGWLSDLLEMIPEYIPVKILQGPSFKPTAAQPGSLAKQYRLCQRIEQGLPLWHPNDWPNHDE